MRHTPLKVSRSGRVYRPGKIDETLRQHVLEVIDKHPDLSERAIAKLTMASPSFVHSIRRPAPPLTPVPHKHTLNTKESRVYLTALCDSQKPESLAQIQSSFEKDFGERFDTRTFGRAMETAQLTKQVAIKVDPRKFTEGNCDYYLRFRHWQECLTTADSLHLCFFDEAHVDKTSKLTSIS